MSLGPILPDPDANDPSSIGDPTGDPDALNHDAPVTIPESTGSGVLRRYGLKRDKYNPTDRMYAPPPVSLAALPNVVDMRAQWSTIYDQGEIGSCTSMAIGGLFQTLRRIEGKPDWIPSRLFIYYNERAKEGTIDQDAGAAISDGMQVCSTLGVPPETDWPYVTARFRQKPPIKAYQDAKPHIFKSDERINNLDLGAMLICLASGFPFVAGIQVYQSFESQQTASSGNVPMPNPGGGDNLLGGHAIGVCGFNRTEQYFIGVNSWSKSWGQGGFFTIPFAFFTNPTLSSDFRTARLAS